jgi:hypothetical protein
MLAHTLDHISIERARVALLVVDADGRQIVYDRFALDLELARQIVNTDLFQCIQFPVTCFQLAGSDHPFTQLLKPKLLLALVRLFAVHVDFRLRRPIRRRHILFAVNRVGFECLAGVGKLADALL